MITSIHNPKVKKIIQLLNKPKIRKKRRSLRGRRKEDGKRDSS